MRRFEAMAAAGVSLALAASAAPALADAPATYNNRPVMPDREHPGVISGDIRDICISEAFGLNADGSLWNPANSVGEEFPNFKKRPHILRITHLFGPEVEDVCEAQVIASRMTMVTPMFQKKNGRYVRASQNSVIFRQRSNPQLTGLHAEDADKPKGKNVYTQTRYAGGNILLKATTVVATRDGKTYGTSGIKVVSPDGTATVGTVPTPGLRRN